MKLHRTWVPCNCFWTACKQVIHGVVFWKHCSCVAGVIARMHNQPPDRTDSRLVRAQIRSSDVLKLAVSGMFSTVSPTWPEVPDAERKVFFREVQQPLMRIVRAISVHRTIVIAPLKASAAKTAAFRPHDMNDDALLITNLKLGSIRTRSQLVSACVHALLLADCKAAFYPMCYHCLG